MRGAIDLLGKKIEIEDSQYEITNVHFVHGSNNFYVELENEDGLLNVSLKDLTSHINEQIKPNGSYRKKYIDC